MFVSKVRLLSFRGRFREARGLCEPHEGPVDRVRLGGAEEIRQSPEPPEVRGRRPEVQPLRPHGVVINMRIHVRRLHTR